MKILFDLRKTGIGNNGGSSTLVKSGNTLAQMGHDITFIDSGRNQHTWTPLIAKHQIVKQRLNIPKADFIIATGYRSVSETVNAPISAGIKCHYIRAWETWNYSEHKIINNILKAPTIKLVNSIGLQRKLKSYGFDSHLIRPGYDFDDLKPLSIRNKRSYIIIGGLNKQGKHVNTKRTEWLIEAAKVLKRKYKTKVKFWMFGMDKLPTTTIVDKYIKNPSVEDKNRFYNEVNIWMAPSKLEGLHLPPAEAMITECPVVGTNAELSGTKDYLINNETGIVTNNDLSSFINGVEQLYLNRELRRKLGKNARIKILEIGNRVTNMKILEDLFLKLKT